MWPYAESQEDTYDNIIKDIQTFAMPNSCNTLRRGKAGMDVEWKIGKRKYSATFCVDRNRIVNVKHENNEYMYAQFFASEEMADLLGFAENITNVIPDVEYYVQQKAKISDDESSAVEQKPVEELINQLVQMPEVSNQKFVEASSVFFVRGQAGAGKSVAMQMLAKNQARNYIKAATKFLYFYVDAQGRALTRINEAFAHELQKLYTASITFNSIAALTRNNLIVPIIDGFDELIGSGGFTDAFSSLSAFLSSLDQQGSIIATGRSAFYDDKNFQSIAERYSHNNAINYSFTTIELMPWGEGEIQKFVERRFSSPNTTKQVKEFNAFYEKATSENKRMLSKPFYCSSLANIVADDKYIIDDQLSLIDILVEYLVNREVGKLVTKQDKPLLTKEQHFWLLKQIAEEMWWQEIRSLDRETLTTIAELTTENFDIEAENRPILYDRITFHAFLKSDDDYGNSKRLFENDIYFDHFLLLALIDHVRENSKELKSFLSRSLLGESLLDFLHKKSSEYDGKSISSWVKNISKALEQSKIGSLDRRNGGAFVSSVINQRTDLISGLNISNIDVLRQKICNAKIENARISNSFYQDVDFTGSKLLNCEILDTNFDRICIDPNSTFFGGSNFSPKFNTNSIIIDGIPYYEPNDIENKLESIGVVLPDGLVDKFSDDQKEIMKLLESFLRKVENDFYFDIEDTTDPRYKKVYTSPYWGKLSSLLFESGLLQTKKVKRSGPRGHLYVLSNIPDEIMMGINIQKDIKSESVKTFWAKFKALNPSS